MKNQEIKVEFTPEEIEEMIKYYSNELRSLLSKVEKNVVILKKLGTSPDEILKEYDNIFTSNEIYAKSLSNTKSDEKSSEPQKKERKSLQKMLNKWQEIVERSKYDPAAKEFIDLMNDESIPVIDFGYKKNNNNEQKENTEITEIIPSNYRRNKNILWSDYVYDKLRLTGYPLTVEELNNTAFVELGLDESELSSSFSAIHSALFRLKRNQKKINNYALKGSRTCYYGLAEWFTSEGKLLKKYSRP